MSTPTERRYRREARYSKQLRVTVQPATAAALEAEADAAGLSVSAVIRDALAARRARISRAVPGVRRVTPSQATTGVFRNE